MIQLNFFRPADIPVEYMDGLDLFLWSASIVFLFAGVAMFIQYANKSGLLESTKKLFYSFAALCFFMGINKISFILAYLTPYYHEALAIGYIAAALSLVYMLFVMERYLVKRTGYIFTGFSVFIAIFMSSVLLFPRMLETIRNTGMIMGSIAPLLILAIWIIAAVQVIGLPRKKAVMTLFGFILVYLAYFLDSELIIRLRMIDDSIAPLLFCSGLLIIFYFQLLIEKEE